jgi:hypothetical protein
MMCRHASITATCLGRLTARTSQLLVALCEHSGTSPQVCDIERQQFWPIVWLHALPERAHRCDAFLWQDLQLLLLQGIEIM